MSTCTAGHLAHGRMAARLTALWIWGLCLAISGQAVSAPSGSTHRRPRKSLRAIRTGTGHAPAPVLDGRLDDAVWAQAAFVSDFVQKLPREGGVPLRRTEVAVAYDEQALYVGARMFAQGIEDVQSAVTRRDDTGTAEVLAVSLDTFHDRRTAYNFAVTAAGVRVDWYSPDDHEYQRDFSYSPVWSARTVITAEGWTAEMRIPFSQLRFARGTEQAWGINFNRYRPQDTEDVFWIAVPSTVTGWSSYFGELEGLEGIRQPPRIEISPYLAADLTLSSRSLVDAADPYHGVLAPGGRAGLDAKIGLGSSLTLDATLNPDFGQVEADPAQVNLTGFETFFSERRPFFIEGSELLSGNGPGYFYSRRIGAAPHGTADGDYVDAPASVPILGAAKLTGRMGPGVGVGALAAITPRTHARAWDAASETEREVVVEPLTAYGVLRAQKELGGGASVIGASLTGVARALDADESLAQELARQAVSGGVDWRLRFDQGVYELAGHLGFSHIRGQPAAITQIAQRSVHYFQRPDQPHVSLDSTRASMSGLTAAMRVGKRAGNWQWSTGSTLETPGLELNDIGKLQSADSIGLTASVLYQDPEPGRLLHSWNAVLESQNEWNWGGHRLANWLGSSASLTWKNFWNTQVSAGGLLPSLDAFATRGGPLMGMSGGVEASVAMYSPSNRRAHLGLQGVCAAYGTGPTGCFVSASLSLRPVDRLSVSVSSRYERMVIDPQYVATQAGGRDETFGNRYIFGSMDKQELSTQLRMQLAFSPNLAIEAYAEPFATSGAYSDLGELAAPRSQDVLVYGRDTGMVERTDGEVRVSTPEGSFTLTDPDFTVLSLRSTVVLRWEFLPGSTVFAVWQANRSSDDRLADSITPASLGRSFASAGTHTLALKLAYWWAPE